MGAISAVGFGKLFMAAYPVLLHDQTVTSAAEQPIQWTSAMTYKFVGALRSLTEDKPYQRTAIVVGIELGFATELLRKLIAVSRRYRQYLQQGGAARRHRFHDLRGAAALSVRLIVRRLRQPAHCRLVCRRQHRRRRL